MKPPPFAYERPRGVEEVLGLLAEHGDEAQILAGGQSLVPVLNLRLSYPVMLVDVRDIGELRDARFGDGAELGAMITHASIEDDTVPDPTGGFLPHVARGIGYRAVRNRGTIGGSLVHADPSAEWPVVMCALGADVVVRSVRGTRIIPIRDLYRGHFTTTIDPDDLLLRVDIPSLEPNVGLGFHKQARKVGEFAESLAVAICTHGPDDDLEDLDLWLGAASDVPLRISGIADVVRHEQPSSRLRAVHAHVAAALPEPSNSEGRYLRHLHGVAAGRALAHALEQETQ